MMRDKLSNLRDYSRTSSQSHSGKELLKSKQVIPHALIRAVSNDHLPRFYYDAVAIGQRAAMAASLLNRYYFPIKACPEPEIVGVAVKAGHGLDLCSEGDLELARNSGCPAERWKFTSPCASESLLRRLSEAGAALDADSVEQALRWIKCGGEACGLRITAKLPKALYGAKFGIQAGEIKAAVRKLTRAGGRMDGLHLHDQNENLTPTEFATRLGQTLAEVGTGVLGACRYVNIGGSWPMRFGNPASVEQLQAALNLVRERLSGLGFQGALYGEPGRWVVGPCGYWAARVDAVKPHPLRGEHRIVVLDTNTPVPCRPSLAPFAVVRQGQLLQTPCTMTCDIFGAANTALDSIGANVRLPALIPGDVLISFGQGAYTRSLVPPFNERERPGATVLINEAGVGQSEQPGEATAKASSDQGCSGLPNVFIFNPFSEGYIARGQAYAPVKHQTKLAEDLGNLPQFLCRPGDIVLVAKRPSPCFQESLARAGFTLPEFVECKAGQIDPASSLMRRKIGGFRPWAWGPDSLRILAPLFDQAPTAARTADEHFNPDSAKLYSKAWSTEFLRQCLSRLSAAVPSVPWLCSGQEVGIAVDTLEETLSAIMMIRQRGHHRVVVKEALGLAGHNAIRLWEPEILPAHRQWLVDNLKHHRQLIVEPWLERELDFSVQLEMEPRGLHLCGYTGLINDLKGQFLANWAEAGYAHRLPGKVAGLLGDSRNIALELQQWYGELFARLETELRTAGFLGPINLDAFVYRTAEGNCKLKPVVEINPRYTMGRLALELMHNALPGHCGLFRLVNQAQLRAGGFADFTDYATSLNKRFPLQLAGDPVKIRQGALCLNDPAEAQVCLATFTVEETLHWPTGPGAYRS